MINRILKMKGHRIFRDFSWPSDLHEFARYNVFYGWNGSGKSTLSKLFSCLQRSESILEGEVIFEVAGAKLHCDKLSVQTCPSIRVFNPNFIDATVHESRSTIAPIYYLGVESVEKRKQVEKLMEDKGRKEAEVTKAKRKKTDADKALDTFITNKAKLIKELLTGAFSQEYNNYDKRLAKRAFEEMHSTAVVTHLLNDENRESLRKQKDAKPKHDIASVIIPKVDFSGIYSRCAQTLEKCVISNVINELAENKALNKWVKEGFDLQAASEIHGECLYCKQSMPSGRIEAIRQHFSEEYSQMTKGIDSLMEQIHAAIRLLKCVQPPESSRFYEHLHEQNDSCILRVDSALKSASAFLDSLIQSLKQKQDSPFSVPSNIPGVYNDELDMESTIDEINRIIGIHNETSSKFKEEVSNACKLLVQHHIADSYSEYVSFKEAVTTADTALEAIKNEPARIQVDIEKLEREIVGHRKPAEELNVEIHSYLGHNDLSLEVKELGYAIVRNGQPASHLSEGERTALSFLYFLKSLQDKSHDLSKSIVVIDDPVSSLDANALFCAFGYMKERTKEAMQLFVLTHNFSFYRQVRNWFHHLPNQRRKDETRRPARFFMLKATGSAGTRSSSIDRIDRLLEEYESEYHYLFSRIYAETNSSDASSRLEDNYWIPNVARRLLEAFMSFRQPGENGDLYKRMESIPWDQARKVRIHRFLNTFSHCNIIAEPEHDPSALSETKPVLRDLLEMIKVMDQQHYEAMVKLVSPQENDDGL